MDMDKKIGYENVSGFQLADNTGSRKKDKLKSFIKQS
jgi:hypothetical protein